MFFPRFIAAAPSGIRPSCPRLSVKSARAHAKSRVAGPTTFSPEERRRD